VTHFHFTLGEPTRAVYPVDGVEYDAIPVAIFADDEVIANACYCLRPASALETEADVRERAQYECDRLADGLRALAEAGADASFADVNVHELAMLR
jgi:hypothetical protein